MARNYVRRTRADDVSEVQVLNVQFRDFNPHPPKCDAKAQVCLAPRPQGDVH